jgi:hypothetical protein
MQSAVGPSPRSSRRAKVCIGSIRSARFRRLGIRNRPGAQYNPPLGRRLPRSEDSNALTFGIISVGGLPFAGEFSGSPSVGTRNRLQRFLATNATSVSTRVRIPQIRTTGPYPVFGKNALSARRLAKPRKTRKYGRRAAFSTSSPRTFFTIVRDGAGCRR